MSGLTVSQPEQSWQPAAPLLLTRQQAADWCQTSVEIIDEWSYLPNFPIIRRGGGHFVRIHRVGLERWLEEFATQANGEKMTPAGNGSAAGVQSNSRPGRRSRGS